MNNRNNGSGSFNIEVSESNPIINDSLLNNLTLQINQALSKEKDLKSNELKNLDYYNELVSEIVKTATEYSKASKFINSSTNALSLASSTIQKKDFANFINHTFPSFRKEYSTLHAQYKLIIDSKLKIPEISDDQKLRIPSQLLPDLLKLIESANKIKFVVDKEFGSLQKGNKAMIDLAKQIVEKVKDAQARNTASNSSSSNTNQSSNQVACPSFMHSNQNSQNKSNDAMKLNNQPSVANLKSNK